MDLDDYSRRLENVIEDLKGGAHGDLMVHLANNAISLIKDRIVEQGRDGDNKQMTAYSTNPMAVSKSGMTLSAYNRVAGSKEKRKALSWVVVEGKTMFILPQGYKQFRELHGRQTGHVDFTFTGRMWSNVQLRRDKSNLFGGEAVIGAETQEDRAKLESLEKKRGKVLALTKEEVHQIGEVYDKGILQIFRNNGL